MKNPKEPKAIISFREVIKYIPKMKAVIKEDLSEVLNSRDWWYGVAEDTDINVWRNEEKDEWYITAYPVVDGQTDTSIEEAVFTGSESELFNFIKTTI